jgi:PrtD family type I secretion system ABC transporter
MIDPSQEAEPKGALRRCRTAFASVGIMSAMINGLYLTGSLYMLEVYDRVLPSRSIQTLVALTILAVGLYLGQGILDAIRARILARIGTSLDENLGARMFDLITRLPLKIGQKSEGLQPLRDLDSVRSFLSGMGPIALFDLPWMPFYIVICFLFHPLIGLTALAGAVVLSVITFATEILTRPPIRKAAADVVLRNGLAETARRNAEPLMAMGMLGALAERWETLNQDYVRSQRRASDVAGGLTALSKVLRLMLQSLVLGVGAYLVVHQLSTPGIIIAGSILTARALAPVDLAIANWKGFVAARQGWKRLEQVLALVPAIAPPIPLNAPQHSLTVENAATVAPGGKKIIVHDINFSLQAGAGLGILGPSGSGKSSLARMLVGVWPAVRGTIRLDGAALDQWSSERLGRFIGYLPQRVELLSGTVAQNISRFDPNLDPANVIDAAKLAGVHDLILSLDEGYETLVGEQGTALSAGQAQRIALARALYRDPFLIVLDEPNSNLDADGDQALTFAIQRARARGAVVVVIAHRPSAIAAVELVLVMREGRQQAFGPKEAVLGKMKQSVSVPLTVVPNEAQSVTEANVS